MYVCVCMHETNLFCEMSIHSHSAIYKLSLSLPTSQVYIVFPTGSALYMIKNDWERGVLFMRAPAKVIWGHKG